MRCMLLSIWMAAWQPKSCAVALQAELLASVAPELNKFASDGSFMQQFREQQADTQAAPGAQQAASGEPHALTGEAGPEPSER